MIGKLYSNSTISIYQPSDEVCLFTKKVGEDYIIGDDILTRPWTHLNDLSVIDRENRDNRTFNALVDESVEDPNEAWKWRGTRSTARKKAIAMHAQLTANYIVPMFSAQNEFDDEDLEMADVMRTIVEWMIENSNYKSSFLLTVMGMLTSPVTYLGADYAHVMQKIKDRNQDGSLNLKEIVDEVLSGFQAPVYGPSEILITNAFQQNIQRQRGIIKKRYIEYSEAAAKYGEHPNWDSVKPGVRNVFNSEDGLFYEIYDRDHATMVEEATVLYRRDDTEVCFLNGIYFGDIDNVDANPIRHRDNMNAPKYDVVPFGYHRINSHFFYFKSMMFELGWDDQLIDAQYELIMNRSLLDVNAPIAVSGSDQIDTQLIFPSSVIAFQNPETKIQKLLPDSNMSGALGAMHEVERSMAEGSLSDVQQGGLPPTSTKATAISESATNAKILLSAVGKSMGISVAEYGRLMADIAINHITPPQVEELLGSGGAKLKYRKFTIEHKADNGKRMNKRIRFDEGLIGNELSPEEIDRANIELFEEAGGMNDEKSAIIVANPEIFAKLRYLVRVDPAEMFEKNEEYTKALMSQLYTQLANDPYVDRKGLVHRLLFAYFRGSGDDLMAKNVPSVLGPQDGLDAPQTDMGAQATQRAISTGLRPTGAVPGV